MDADLYTKMNEGKRLTAYQDSLRGVWTCGFGSTGVDVCKGVVWTEAYAGLRFEIDAAIATGIAGAVLGYGAKAPLGPVRWAALRDMAFELGHHGLADFPQMIGCLRAGDWAGAKLNCLDSLYAREQVPDRAARNAGMFLTGLWPAAPF